MDRPAPCDEGGSIHLALISLQALAHRDADGKPTACLWALAIWGREIMIILPPQHDVSYELGEARFATYLNAVGDDECKASRPYMWNLSLCERCWGPLSYIEVAFRNEIHFTLAEHIDQDDWWSAPSCNLSNHSRRNLAEAMRFATGRERSNPSADDVVAASSFGLWTSLIHRESAQTMWRNCLDKGFQDRGSLSRGDIYDTAYKLKKFRDRIAHHEPIFAQNHAAMKQRLLTLCGSMNSTLAEQFMSWFPALASAIEGYDNAINHGMVDL